MHRMCSSIFRFDKNGAERCMFCDSFINILGSDIIHNLPLCDFWKQMRDAGLCYSRKNYYTNTIYAYSTFRNNVVKFLTGYDTWRNYEDYEVILKDKSKSKKVERSASCKLLRALYHFGPDQPSCYDKPDIPCKHGADPTEPERVDDRKENE